MHSHSWDLGSIPTLNWRGAPPSPAVPVMPEVPWQCKTECPHPYAGPCPSHAGLSPCRTFPRPFTMTVLISPLLPSLLFAFPCFQVSFPSTYHLPPVCIHSCCLTHSSSAVLWVHPLLWAFLSHRAAALSHQAQFHPRVSDSTADIHQTAVLWGQIQCSQGPQVPSSVMGKTASLGREVEIIFLNFKYL